jgi:hypothetical protein
VAGDHDTTDRGVVDEVLHPSLDVAHGLAVAEPEVDPPCNRTVVVVPLAQMQPDRLALARVDQVEERAALDLVRTGSEQGADAGRRVGDSPVGADDEDEVRPVPHQ